MTNSGSNSYADSDSNSAPNSGAGCISDFEVTAPESQVGRGPVLSAAVVERKSERHSPRVTLIP